MSTKSQIIFVLLNHLFFKLISVSQLSQQIAVYLDKIVIKVDPVVGCDNTHHTRFKIFAEIVKRVDQIDIVLTCKMSYLPKIVIIFSQHGYILIER